MKRKLKTIISATLITASILGAFFIGKNQAKTQNIEPDKYNYLALQSIMETQIKGNTLYIYTSTGDYYTFDINN